MSYVNTMYDSWGSYFRNAMSRVKGNISSVEMQEYRGIPMEDPYEFDEIELGDQG